MASKFTLTPEQERDLLFEQLSDIVSTHERHHTSAADLADDIYRLRDDWAIRLSLVTDNEGVVE